ncbi:MAG: DUF533 domain-containing protein [Kofleriaceae bacterium]|nr:DUF533 domain-containing protein [Myxococcales bacterium]MCB9562573.1 DUF533 domain-containing protein [Kofleriaceae bacterium]
MSDQDYLLTAFKVWAAAAWADGVIVDAERATMQAIIAASKLSDEQRAVATGWLAAPVTVDDAELAKIPEHERLHIYSVACGVAAMDRDVAAAEQAFVERLATALGISKADADKARQGAGH